MKKYLMTGIAALALCVGFTSCSHDLESLSEEEINELQAKKIVDNYNKAFKAYIGGEVASTQTWGFGVADTRTRSGNTGETYPATHQYNSDGQAFDENQTATGTVVAGANMNHNEWADPDKTYGGWVVPDPLTDAQKALVARYFQTVDDMSYEDPQLRHFFVQQVYKGGKVNDGKVNNTTEGITAADGSKYDSDNMNLLTVGQYNSHINDFNAGTCSESDVLDNGQHVGGTSHKDQITLMVNVDDTSCFGYHETGSSTHHNDKAALVSWQTIAQWQVANGEISKIEDCILNDDWDRSYLGFDLAIKEGAQAYAKDANGNIEYATYAQAPERPEYAWDGENVIRITTGEMENVQVGNQWSTWTEQRPVYIDGYKTIMNVGWLTTNENFYVAADKVTLDQSYQVNGTPADLDGIKNAVILKEFTVNGQKYQSVINLPKIQQLVSQGYVPVKDNSLQEWVQVGTSDGYYSDWIVTLTEAKRIDDGPDPTKFSVRVMAEDLSATDASDFDFNDVVFDVAYTEGQSTATITLLAAGGTLPLRVNSTNGVGGFEVHAAFGEYPTTTMINTGWTGSNGANNVAPAVLTIENFSATDEASFLAAVKAIRIEVRKTLSTGDYEWLEMKAEAGEPASKFAVPVGTTWCTERTSIKAQYETFAEWARTGSLEFKWW